MAELRVQVGEGTRKAIFRVLSYIEENGIADYGKSWPLESNLEDLVHSIAMDLVVVATMLQHADG